MLKGKKGLIIGVANEKSIAWGIAKMCYEYGTELAFSYQGEILEKRVRPLAESVNSSLIFECDVSSDESIDKLALEVEKNFGKIDFILHSVAFASRDALKGKYFDFSREDFKQSMDISVFSLTAIAKKFLPIMNFGGSILTLSYYGSEKIIPNYNIMGVAKAALEASVMYLANDLGENGIRINSISAGPVRTLAASAIGDFKSILEYNEKSSPLKRNVTLEDIAGTAVYLFSDLASGVTGENIHVDCGMNKIGLSKHLLKED